MVLSNGQGEATGPFGTTGLIFHRVVPCSPQTDRGSAGAAL
jgi:hypothetical protein